MKHILLSHQKAPYAELRAVASAFFREQWKNWPIKPRFHTLIVGSTGVGKTQMVKHLASDLGKPVLALDTASWILIGASRRGVGQTWPMIRDFVSDNMPDGGIIFVDEIDKIAQAKSGNEWSQFLRCEIMSLLDGRMPLGMDDNEWDEDLCSNSAIAKPTPSQLQQSLNDRFFVVAAGAFQEAWEHHAKPAIGFEPLQASTKGFILKTEAIERELLNRFRRHLIHVDVTPADYQQMIKTVAKQLPKDQAENFRKLAQQRLSKAIDEMRGVRLLEELLLDSMLKIEKTESSKTPNL